MELASSGSRFRDEIINQTGRDQREHSAARKNGLVPVWEGSSAAVAVALSTFIGGPEGLDVAPLIFPVMWLRSSCLVPDYLSRRLQRVEGHPFAQVDFASLAKSRSLCSATVIANVGSWSVRKRVRKGSVLTGYLIEGGLFQILFLMILGFFW